MSPAAVRYTVVPVIGPDGVEARETLNKYEYNGDAAPVGRVAPLPALHGDERRMTALAELLDGVERHAASFAPPS